MAAKTKTAKKRSQSVSSIIKADQKKQAILTAEWQELSPASRKKILVKYFTEVEKNILGLWANMSLTDIGIHEGYKTAMGVLNAMLEHKENTPTPKAYKKSVKPVSTIGTPMQPGIYFHIFDGKLCLVEATGEQKRPLSFSGTCIFDQTKRNKITGNLETNWAKEVFTLIPNIETVKF